MLRLWRNLLLGLLAVIGGAPVRAFVPPVTNVTAQLITNRFAVTLHCEATDPVLGGTMVLEHSYPGNISTVWAITGPTVSTGIVTWVAASVGSYTMRDREVGLAVYDPIRQVWQERTYRYEGTTSSSWTVGTPLVTNGVVSWRANGAGLAHAWDTEVACATFDPLRGEWNVRAHQYSGTDSSYWAITNLQASGGLITWARFNLGQFALGHKEVTSAIFDPFAGVWAEDVQLYESHLNNVWTLSNHRIASQSVQWTATNKNTLLNLVRGYQQPSGTWAAQATAPVASFVTSATTGAAPFSVWFVDMSLGATNCVWNFGDGTSTGTNGGTMIGTNGSLTTARSPLHVFESPGVFNVRQTVFGPGGTNQASALVTVQTAVSPLVFNTNSVAVTNGEFSAELTGATAARAVVIYVSTNLVDWTPVRTNPPQAEPIVLSDPIAPETPGRFYRAVAQ